MTINGDGPDATRRRFEALDEAVAALRAFVEAHPGSMPLSPADVRSLERLFDRYLTADEALVRRVEAILRWSGRRPPR